jgi:acyl carrier protein
MEENQTIAEIKEFIETNIVAASVRLEAETNLQDAGIDSFSIVEIILFIQRRFGIAIPDAQLLPENFKTLRSLARMVKQLSA